MNLTDILRAVRDDCAPNVNTDASRRWFAGFNTHIRAALAARLVVEAPRRRCAYRLTPAGRAALGAL